MTGVVVLLLAALGLILLEEVTPVDFGRLLTVEGVRGDDLLLPLPLDGRGGVGVDVALLVGLRCADGELPRLVVTPRRGKEAVGLSCGVGEERYDLDDMDEDDPLVDRGEREGPLDEQVVVLDDLSGPAGFLFGLGFLSVYGGGL